MQSLCIVIATPFSSHHTHSSWLWIQPWRRTCVWPGAWWVGWQTERRRWLCSNALPSTGQRHSRRHDRPVAPGLATHRYLTKSPPTIVRKKVNGIILKDTCSFFNKVETLLCELLSRCVDERRYSGIKCLNNFESLYTSPWKPSGLWTISQYAWGLMIHPEGKTRIM